MCFIISNESYDNKKKKVPYSIQKSAQSDHLGNLSSHILHTHHFDMGPVVQSVVSLMSSLRAISLTILADSIYNFLKFFAEKIFSAKNFSIFAYH